MCHSGEELRALVPTTGRHPGVRHPDLAVPDLPPSPPRAKPFDDSNGREFPVAVWTGAEYVTWSGGNGGDIVWVPNDGAAFRPAGRLDP